MPSAPEPANRSSTAQPRDVAEDARTAPRARGRRWAGWPVPVGARRARRPPTRAGDRRASVVARSVPRRALITRSRCNIALAPTLGSAPRSAPNTPASASASSACSGVLQLRVRSVDALGAQPGPLQQLARRAAARRRGTGPARSGGSPTSSPSPRSSRSISARRKPSACVGQRPQPRRALGPEQQAQRRVLAAADPAAQLVQLGDPVALGVLDQHHRRVGDVDADLDHRGGDEHVGARRPRTRASPPASRPGAAGRACSTTRKSRSSPVAQALELGGRRAGLQRLGLRHQRADDERLAPGAQLLADPVVGPRALALGGADVGLDRLAALGQLAQHGEVEVAVAATARACAGSAWRSCAARAGASPVRRLGVQRGALADPEAVLLVDHRDGERGEARPASSISAWVPTISDSSPLASLPSRSARRPRRASSRSAGRSATASPGISAWSVAKCCSASGSVGAISAPW